MYSLSLLALASVASAQIAGNLGFYSSEPDSDNACSGLIGNLTIKVESLSSCQPLGFSDPSIQVNGKTAGAVDGNFQFWEKEDCTGSTQFQLSYTYGSCDEYTGTGADDDTITVDGQASKGYIAFNPAK
jgi:hypothetical protein